MTVTSFSKKRKIVVVGVGAVGSTTAYTLLLRQRMDELVLIDANKEKAIGDALDMNHGLAFLGRQKFGLVVMKIVRMPISLSSQQVWHKSRVNHALTF